MFSPEVVFSWHGLPQYAARLIRAAIVKLDRPCAVIGSRPSVPIQGMESILEQEIIWVDPEKETSWRDLLISPPKVFIQAGWGYKAFSSLGREAKAFGGAVIGLSDANWRGDFRQIFVGPIAFRLLHRDQFDAILVPGRQAARLMSFFGMPRSKIRTGLYGADPDVFNGGMPLEKRPKSFLYVGQFIARKNVLSLTNAFLCFSKKFPDWTLHLVGSGCLRDQIPSDPRIILDDFVQPEQLVNIYREARFFILPSLSEAWGLVVHEAALCGCGLLLSDSIGSADDLSSELNSFRFSSNNERAIIHALEAAASLSSDTLAAIDRESRLLARQFGPSRFAAEVFSLVNSIANNEVSK